MLRPGSACAKACAARVCADPHARSHEGALTTAVANLIAAPALAPDRLWSAMRSCVEPLGPRLGGIRALAVMGGRIDVADSTTKACVVNARGKSVAVVLCASDRSPAMVARGVERAEQARVMLGSALGSVILKPLDTGQIEGRSYVVLPYCQPLKRSHWGWKFQRRWLTPYVLRWLHGAAEVTAVPAPADFAAPLRHMAEHPHVSAQTRALAGAALARLESGGWQPRHALDHNDFWKSNIMLPPAEKLGERPAYPFTIIDWVGANPRGYGVYDLVRFCKSMKLDAARIDRELNTHCQALGVQRADAMGHMLASLGYIGLNIEEFPMDRYVKLVESCVGTLREADQRAGA